MTETLIFLHVPKAAGTTLSKVLTRQFEFDEIFHVRNDPESRGPMFGAHVGTAAELAAADPATKQRVRLVLGHLDYGIHEALPQPARYITFVRDPAARVVSHYKQYRRRLELDGGQPPTLTAYLESPERPSDIQTRYIAGWHAFSPAERETALQRALEHLRSMAFIGTVERFDESLVVLARLFGWEHIAYVPENSSNRRAPGVEVAVSPDDLRRIESLTQLDQALYAEAGRRLDAAIADYGPGFEQDLDRFRKAKRRFQRLDARANMTVVGRWIDRAKALVGR